MIMCSLCTHGMLMRGRSGLLSTYQEHVEFVLAFKTQIPSKSSVVRLV